MWNTKINGQIAAFSKLSGGMTTWQQQK